MPRENGVLSLTNPYSPLNGDWLQRSGNLKCSGEEVLKTWSAGLRLCVSTYRCPRNGSGQARNNEKAGFEKHSVWERARHLEVFCDMVIDWKVSMLMMKVLLLD